NNGVFSVTLDFGAGVFPGPARWLEIAVRTNGSTGPYNVLIPRQALTATPYAITAGNLTGMLSASQLNGTLPLAQLPEAVLTNNQAAVSLTGAFSGNGAFLTNLSAANLIGSIAGPQIASGAVGATQLASGGAVPSNGQVLGFNGGSLVWTN